MSTILEFLEKIDRDVLLMINGAHTPLMDRLMWIVSMRLAWIPLYVVFTILIFRDYRWGGLIILTFALLAILLSDQTCNLLKDQFMKLRPSHTAGLSNQLHYYKDNGEDYMGGDYGFPSNHAANATTLAIYLMLLFRNRYVSFSLFLYVLIVCYSRIYLGVHYPSDVLGGIGIGIVAGSVAHKVCMLIQRGTSLWDD